MGKDLKGKELGEGVSQRKDGKYTARFRNKSGKRIQKYFDKSIEAKRWIINAKYEDAHNNIGASSNMLFDTWFNCWMDNIHTAIKMSTKKYYHQIYRNHIKEYIGQMIISDIKQLHCQNILNIASKKELSASTMIHLSNILNMSLDSAVENEIINYSPMTSTTKYINNNQKERRYLSKNETDIFLKYTKENVTHYYLYALILQTGLRISEALGLKWSDIDFENKILHVNRILYYNSEKKIYEFTEPKTINSKRIIPLTQEAITILKDRKKINNKLPKMIGFQDLIFLNKYGKPINKNTLNTRLYSIAKILNMPKFSLHCLRHTFATRCIEAGMRPKTLQKILGHKNLSITMNLYVHVSDEELKNEMLKFEFEQAI